MKKYIVTIERKGEIISDFAVSANNLKEAQMWGQVNKIDVCEGWGLNPRECKTNVRLAKY